MEHLKDIYWRALNVKFKNCRKNEQNLLIFLQLLSLSTAKIDIKKARKSTYNARIEFIPIKNDERQIIFPNCLKWN